MAKEGLDYYQTCYFESSHQAPDYCLRETREEQACRLTKPLKQFPFNVKIPQSAISHLNPHNEIFFKDKENNDNHCLKHHDCFLIH